MNKYFFAGAFALGVMAVFWVAAGFFGSSSVMALAMTATIAAVFGFGALELSRFRKVTAGLTAALAVIPADLKTLGEWLGQVPAALQSLVRLRIEGERVALPGPALTPYLVGMLVMLGMLGTFLGMVVTLNGAVFALEGTADLQAIRTAFAAPIKGLGLSFGTSVAGVATSAMLGLMSAISRRERMAAAQLLDIAIATSLRSFSLTHQRQETYRSLQQQSLALPTVLQQMQAMMEQMERVSQQLNARLLNNQESFHQEVRVAYTELAKSVDQSLRDSLSHSAQAAGDSIRPLVATAMNSIAQEAHAMHHRLVDSTQTQLDGLAARISETAAVAARSYVQALAHQERNSAAVLSGLTGSLQGMATALSQEWRQAGEQTLAEQRQVYSALRQELGALRDDESMRGRAAVERLGELQAALTVHLTTLGAALEDPITRLIAIASEAPRAAAEVIGKLREEVASSAARDNALLEERGRIIATLSSLLDGINHASVEQRAVIDSLVTSSAVALGRAGSQFADKVDAEAAKLADVAANVTGSAVEVSALSESFGFAVQAFNAGNDKLIANLQRIEAAMDKSMNRSDEQLAYYVAQAREIIDLSILSQKEVFDALRQLPAKHAVLAQEAS